MNGRGISNNGHNLSAFCPQTNLLICKERNARLPKEWKLILYSEEKEILALKAFTPLLLKRFFCNWFTFYGLWSSLMKQKCYSSLYLFCKEVTFSLFSVLKLFLGNHFYLEVFYALMQYIFRNPIGSINVLAKALDSVIKYCTCKFIFFPMYRNNFVFPKKHKQMFQMNLVARY